MANHDQGREDLKGKKVGIGTPAGSASMAAYVALDHLGLVPRREIVLLGIGGSQRMGALRSGSVDATVCRRRSANRCSAKVSCVGRLGERKGAVSILRPGVFA
jgi:hypothetical protein